MSSSTTPMYVVFNDVTGEIQEVETPPNFGDPNVALQSSVSNAYTGGTAASTAGAAAVTTSETPTPATLGDPAAACTVAANTAGLDPATQASIQQALGPMTGLGAIPNMLSSMSSHATNVLNRPTEIMRSVDRVFQPDDVGSPNRCSSLGDFIGSIQGKFNSALTKMATGLGQLANALISVPVAIIQGFTAATSALLAAITSGITSVINAAIKVVGTATNAVLGGLGSAISGVVSGISKAATAITAGITNEIRNVTNALNNAFTQPFRLTIPNSNRCLANAVAAAPENTSQQAVVAGHGGVEPQPPPPTTTTDQPPSTPPPRSPDVLPRYDSPTAWVNGRGYPVNADGTPYQATQQELWRMGLDGSPGPMNAA